jgi:hypothetical protein
MEPLQPCDIFLVRGTGLVSRLIRFFSRGIGESRTIVNHAGLVVAGGDVQQAVVVEAVRFVRRRRLWAGYGSGSDQVAVFRPLNLTPDEAAKVVAAAESYVGRQYGYVMIAAHALDWFFFHAYLFRRLIRSDNYPICSWVVASAYAKAGKNFDVAPGEAEPDDIWDFVTNQPDKYREIRPLARLAETATEPTP